MCFYLCFSCYDMFFVSFVLVLAMGFWSCSWEALGVARASSRACLVSWEVFGSSWRVLGDSRGRNTLHLRSLMILENNVFFKRLKSVAQDGFQTHPEDTIQAPGRVLLGARRGGSEGLRTKRRWYGRAQDLRTNTQSPFFVFLGSQLFIFTTCCDGRPC